MGSRTKICASCDYFMESRDAFTDSACWYEPPELLVVGTRIRAVRPPVEPDHFCSRWTPSVIPDPEDAIERWSADATDRIARHLEERSERED